jgi:hypothetical protein
MSIGSFTSLPSPFGRTKKAATIKRRIFMEWDTGFEDKFLDRIYRIYRIYRHS